jgi:hypothetical protein
VLLWEHVDAMTADVEAITGVLVRYATAIDTKDWPLLRSCFIGDVVADYGDIGTWRGIDDLVGFMDAAHAGMGPTQHLLSNYRIDVDGDLASSVTYVHAVTVLARDPDDWIDTIGVYEDRLVRAEDGWRIAGRTFRTTRTVLSPSLMPSSRRATPPEHTS